MASQPVSAEVFEQQYRTAQQRGAIRLKNAPRARSAAYDRATRRIVVELVNDCTFVFPVDLAQGLRGASDTALADIRLLSHGLAMDWPLLDVQFSLDGLLAGEFGTKHWMSEQYPDQDR
jgi:hypothetical protein